MRFDDDIPYRLESMLLRLNKRGIVNAMIAALDEMEGYNGQCKTSAIYRAIGATEHKNENGQYWTPPRMAEMKRQFN